ncbi:unnamed protein product [Acidithrix sp. C25]|nr:unnamed protein product [Acidithrix sp. C25]
MSLSRILNGDAEVRNFFSSLKSQLTDRNGYPMALAVWNSEIKVPELVNPLKAEKWVPHLTM